MYVIGNKSSRDVPNVAKKSVKYMNGDLMKYSVSLSLKRL